MNNKTKRVHCRILLQLQCLGLAIYTNKQYQQKQVYMHINYNIIHKYKLEPRRNSIFWKLGKP